MAFRAARGALTGVLAGCGRFGHFRQMLGAGQDLLGGLALAGDGQLHAVLGVLDGGLGACDGARAVHHLVVASLGLEALAGSRRRWCWRRGFGRLLEQDKGCDEQRSHSVASWYGWAISYHSANSGQLAARVTQSPPSVPCVSRAPRP